ncbi:MAG: threonine/serine exporter family protein [Oscillospiraceae bacterium]
MTNKEIFDLVADFGVTMLANGGELSRAKVTMEKIAEIYQIREFSVYIIANGIFVTGVMGDGSSFSTKVINVPISPTHLDRVDEVNKLSRDISTNNVTPEEAKRRLEIIKTTNLYNFTTVTLATGLGCMAFCYLFKGTFYDCFVVFFVGALLNIFSSFISKNPLLPKILKNLFASAFITLLCCFARFLGLGNSVGSMIIGCIMPLVPGIPLTNSIRHFFDDDYLSGVIRLADALITALSVAVGVGIVILMWNSLVGGMIL